MTQPELIEISIRDLGYEVEGRSILTSVGFSTKARRIGVVGRNGSGKSTLAKLLSGLEAPTRGQIRVGGIDPFADRATAIETVGVLFQNPDHQIIFPTVIEELIFGLIQIGRPKGAAIEEARTLLRDFGKAHWEEAATHTLSQGQKHLLCLMAVVLMKPKLIILDEPFAGLDLPTKLQLGRYLSKFEGQLLHISHDPADIRDYDEVLWIDGGTLRHKGPTGETLALYLEAMTELGASDDIADLSR
ncbi:ABC transporter ATP-binding protein [Marivivens sp. LCG002]|uniref:energy-coupling factor ABC transporter ATP-binding protein n=1 Tax=Marivivens sp. LCG002 TaxID=3051171 RepID=UPI0025571067|nr:ABC transporter ATP-binding protein [Marivivens sp. LCG002]WIV51442.1 ABC transporter ATP-binding protein [Marivivens sp. LCG002]